MSRPLVRLLTAGAGLVVTGAIWAGTAQAKADLTVQVSGQLAHVRVVLRAEGRRGTTVVAARPAKTAVVFRRLKNGRYAVTAVGPGAIGGFAYVKIGSRPARVSLAVRTPQLDRARGAAGNFQPGTPLVLEATDARGVQYRLFLPGDAFDAATPVAVTPLAAAVAPGHARGLGVRIDPAGAALKREAELTVAGDAAALRRYDVGTGAWVALPRDADAGDGRYVLSTLGLVAPATLGGRQRAANFAYELGLGHLADAALESATGAVAAPSARSARSLRAQFTAFAKSGCASSLDKSGLIVARAVVPLVQGGKKPLDPKLLKRAALRCATQARTAGAGGCQAAEKDQDATARRESREAYLLWAFHVSQAYGVSTRSSSTAYLKCVGYSFKAVVKFQRRTITVRAYTCADLVAGAWAGNVTTGGRDNGGPGGGDVKFDLRTDGSRIDYWPGGSGDGVDNFGAFVQQTWLTATPAEVTVSASVTRGSTVSETPSATAPIVSGTRSFSSQSPCGAPS